MIKISINNELKVVSSIGLNWIKRTFVKNSNYELTMKIVKDGNKFIVDGKSRFEFYQFIVLEIELY